ncbi:MAG: RNA polymerase factor sigma-54 [Sphingobacteriales bacterium]|jgi:RNA polymerase sigma-54 factor|nr:RNA polymerase factor sigma-54 [Sphingobacteriales bacterium]MBP9141790.1 RNA polymerase factor sigma-54 [Chitinophagales bacterium]MDA0199341.1 RNA polymerase factor sigma-54 [Bacteroidota bacterium]MBK6890184.1 RNA polymerase factor sigma-54 [Sphingobacteriales bacterium]MBK7527290.1 RNA polymerase factor sigma-54 [Sphingobacteriales bacterium]
MFKQKLQQKLVQKLSPQHIQLMKLLQIPTAALEERIKEELEANPALEEQQLENNISDPFAPTSASGDTNFEYDEEKTSANNDEENSGSVEIDTSIDLSDYLDNDDETSSYKTQSDNYSGDPDEDRGPIPIPVSETFHENLMHQLGMLDIPDTENYIATQIIGSIDEDGYLRRDIEALADDIAFALNIMVTEQQVLNTLYLVQTFEPAGVGARDLQECLILQIKRQLTNANSKPDKQKTLEYALSTIENYFDEFAKKHFEKLARLLDINSDRLKDIMAEILKLNPKPGGSFTPTDKSTLYIIPDFTIHNNNGKLELTLNARNAPDLYISSTYKDMLKEYGRATNKTRQHKEAILFIKQKIDSAKWFIDAIKQRQQTMLKTMEAIMRYQYDFFLSGDETSLRPMILKDIADITAYDISTISRVSNSKYVQTEFGTFKLKTFFSEALQTESGDEVSTHEVKKILSTMIEGESKRKPLSDQKLTQELTKQGYNIARRTVAKYREQLNFPVARLRKQL